MHILDRCSTCNGITHIVRAEAKGQIIRNSANTNKFFNIAWLLVITNISILIMTAVILKR